MLVVGSDTFISLEDADKYVSEHYTSDDEYRQKWFSLEENDREIWLRRSTNALNNLKYIGRKKGNQRLEFPRIKCFGTYGYFPILYIDQRYDNRLISGGGSLSDPDGMIAIAQATVENALAGAVLNNVVQSNRIANIQGLVAMRAGSVSKNYNRNNRSTVNSEQDIYTDKINSILVDWLQSSRYSM